MNNGMKKFFFNALVWCRGSSFVLFFDLSFFSSFSLPGDMKGYVLLVFGQSTLFYSSHIWCSAGVVFPSSLFHFFCAHHGLSFARVRVRVGTSVPVWRFRVFSSLSYPWNWRAIDAWVGLSWLVLDGYGTSDRRSRRKDSAKTSFTMERRKQQKRRKRRRALCLFLSSSIPLSTPSLISSRVVTYYFFRLGLTFSYIGIFLFPSSFFGEQKCRIGDGLSCLEFLKLG